MNKTTWCQTTLKTQKWKQTEHQRYNHFNNNSFCLPFINFLMCVKMLQRFVYKTYQSSRIYNPKHLFLQILSIASFVVWNKLLAILQMSCCTSSFKTNHDSVNSSVNHLQQNNCFSCSWCFEEECAVRQRRGENVSCPLPFDLVVASKNECLEVRRLRYTVPWMSSSTGV